MTGLDPEKDHILEIATVVTTANLDEIIEGMSIAIFQNNTILESMDEWNTQHHGSSGLIERVVESSLSVTDAQAITLDFLRDWVPAGVSPMCGNTVCQDRRFLCKYMPRLADYFHYRSIDVSTLKELANRWAPRMPRYKKLSRHIAMDDIKESIAELQHYKEFFLKI
jgi:oligoribonuclease